MKPIPRRTFLRGMGTAVALPMLDAMVPLAFAGAPASPRRMAFVYIPNGVHMQDWTPARVGERFVMPYILEPLAPHRKELNVITGLTLNTARALGDGPGDHARAGGAFLTGAHPVKTSGANIRVGVSVDQVAAQQIGRATRFASFELGCEPALQSGQCDSGYSCAYSSNISWRTPHTPVAKEINPRLAFERLFMIGSFAESAAERMQRLKEQKSILDMVQADAHRLRGKLGRTDRQKMDEYFEAVREIERRIEGVEKLGRKEKRIQDGLKIPTGIPRDYREHVRLMYDLMVLAFRLDLTRVSSFMVSNEASNRNYGFIGAPGGHHSLSHHGGDRGKINRIRAINRFHAEEFARFLKTLKAVREGDETLLDNTMCVYGSALSDGNRHNHDHLPVLLAGNGGGRIKTGRHIRYPRETPLCNLYLTMLRELGVEAKTFGDSTGFLPGLT